MATISGTDLVVKFGTAAAEVKTMCATSCTLNINQANVEASCKDSGDWYTGVEGQKSWEVTSDNLYDPDAVDGGFIDVSDLIITGPNKCSVVFGQEETGGTIWTGEAQITAASLTGADNTPATWTCTFMGLGELVKGIVPTP